MSDRYMNDLMCGLCPAEEGGEGTRDEWREHARFLYAENCMLRDKWAKQNWALNQIARQNLVAEMDDAAEEHADIEGGYDTIIDIAREALRNTPSEGPSKTKLPTSPDVGGGPISPIT